MLMFLQEVLAWLYSARALAFTAAGTAKCSSKQSISWAQSGHSTCTTPIQDYKLVTLCTTVRR